MSVKNILFVLTSNETKDAIPSVVLLRHAISQFYTFEDMIDNVGTMRSKLTTVEGLRRYYLYFNLNNLTFTNCRLL